MKAVAASATLALLATACAPASVTSSRPDDSAAGNPALGQAYAQQNCAACHAVNTDEASSPEATAPAFITIANTPGMTHIALNVWLNMSHPNMPNLVVDPDRIEDLSAYLTTLRRNEEPRAP